MSPEPTGGFKENAEDLNTAGFIQVAMNGPESMSKAERAAAEALAEIASQTYGGQSFNVEGFADDARAVVAAVEPHLTIAALERTVTAIEQFAARKRSAGHVRDAVGIDEAAELVLDELRAMRAALRTTTSEETR